MANNINGTTQVFGLIGNPVSHTLSPLIHNTLAQLLGHNLVYVPFPVAEAHVAQAVQGAYALGIRGLNVTIPHKQTVMPFLCALHPSAKNVGAVNTLHRTPDGFVGYNTDMVGIQKVLAAQGVTAGGANVLVLGAGGSAYAAAAAVADLGAASITFVNRTKANTLTLVQQVKTYYNGDVSMLTFDEIHNIDATKAPYVVIQTTSLGFGDNKGVSPVAHAAFFDNVSFALDIVYSPWETAFLRMAKQVACPCCNGFAMLVYQAIAAYEIWQNVTVAPEVCAAVLHTLEQTVKS